MFLSRGQKAVVTRAFGDQRRAVSQTAALEAAVGFGLKSDFFSAIR
jgi:hypothetical protein